MTSHAWTVPVSCCVALLLATNAQCQTSRARPGTAASKGTTVGRYVVPDVPGWTRELIRGDIIASVRFRTQSDGHRILLKFVFTRAPEGVSPMTPSDYERVLHASVEMQKRLAPALGETILRLDLQRTSFRGLPAYVTHRTILARGQTSRCRILQFQGGGGNYLVHLTVRGSGKSAVADRTADRAWRLLTERLRPT
ncbi:MAG TPA: hypothetical protein VLH79_07225 [Chthonomonadales bacterium]|nr:hypothetical protein [Chthonomonadales bacterium]